jgi:hypothetical protein
MFQFWRWQENENKLQLYSVNISNGNLGLWEEKSPVERAPPALIREKSHEPYDDGWPQYEEPSVTIH